MRTDFILIVVVVVAAVVVVVAAVVVVVVSIIIVIPYLSASSKTTYSTDFNFRSISITTCKNRPGVATILQWVEPNMLDI